MKRREFIGIAAVGATGLMWPGTAQGEHVASALASPRLLDVLHDERIVLELGRRYRGRMPTEASARALTEAILPGPYSRDEAGLRERLNDQVQSDFAEGRTVVLNGWILSVTEARQCALYSLRHS